MNWLKVLFFLLLNGCCLPVLCAQEEEQTPRIPSDSADSCRDGLNIRLISNRKDGWEPDIYLSLITNCP